MITQIILLSISVVLIIISLVSYLNFTKVLKNGTRTEGIICDFKTTGSDTSSLIKYPIVRFITTNQEWETHPYKISFLPGQYKNGEKVTIFYNPESPKEFVIKSSNSYISPIILFLTGLVILVLSFFH